MKVRLREGGRGCARLIFFAWLSILTSCITTSPAPQGRAAVVDRPSVFRSEDYVVVELKGGETPTLLAERFLGDANRSWVIEDANAGTPFRKNQRIIIPLKEENIGGLTADGYQTVPILCYHQFADSCESNLCMPTDVFDRQMKYLKDNGFRVVTFSRLLDFLQYRRAIPNKAVLITIDDGYRSVYTHAYPILRKYGYPATLFIYTDIIGVGRVALTWEQLREMKSAGFEIGSHSLSHADLTKPRKDETKTAYLERVRKELVVSKNIIDKKLGQDTRVFAFPYGRHNADVLRVTKEAGYEIAASVKRGGNPFFSEPLALKRDQILNRDMKTFETRLNTFYELSLR
jgi:peptidoglycan/xylan/chitin deacetylase (PgdA/CDA1 family)